MNENDISIVQKLVSEYNNEKIIEIIVENDCDEAIENACVISQNIDHDFGLIDARTSKSVSYTLNIPSSSDLKEDFGEDAEISDTLKIPPVVLKGSMGNESFEAESNELVFVL